MQIRLLLGPIRPPEPIRRRRAPRYGAEVQQALAIAYAAANAICGKRLVPFLPELIPTLERHGHLTLPDEVHKPLLTLSPATADRLLAPVRQPHGMTTTKPGRLLKKQIPVRTFTEWTDVKPGFLEAEPGGVQHDEEGVCDEAVREAAPRADCYQAAAHRAAGGPEYAELEDQNDDQVGEVIPV
jgi:hypothetical protein